VGKIKKRTTRDIKIQPIDLDGGKTHRKLKTPDSGFIGALKRIIGGGEKPKKVRLREKGIKRGWGGEQRNSCLFEG